MATKRDERLVSFDYDILWDNFADDRCELVPLSERETSIILSCLRVAKWAARWFTGDTLLRDVGRLADAQSAIEYIEQLEGKLLMTGCLENLIGVMTEIRDALRASAQCCVQSNSPYNLIDIGEGEVAFGTEQPLTEPPEGEFEDEAAYLAHRCNAANAIVSDLVSAFNQFAIVNLAAIVGGGIIAGGFLIVTVPPVGLFYALLLAGFLFATCELISNYIDDNRQELVCLLYNAETYSDWQIAYSDWVDQLTIELEIEGFGVDLTQMFKALVSTDAYNKMFTALGLPEDENAVSCDSCGLPDCNLVPIGENAVLTYLDDDLWQADSVSVVQGLQYYAADMQFDEGKWQTLESATITVGQFTSHGSGQQSYIYLVDDEDGFHDLGEGATGFAALNALCPVGCKQLYFDYSAYEFTLELQFAGDCSE